MKKLITIVLPVFIGLVAFGLVVLLFFLAKADDAYLLLFGLGTSVLIPLSFSLIKFGFNFKNREVNQKLSDLSKISDIQDLLKKAESTEEQLEILKSEYKNLERTLRYNSQKISLELRRDDLLTKAKEVIRELDSISHELKKVDDNLSNFTVPVEIALLRERVFKQDVAVVRFRNKVYTYHRNTLPDIFPLQLDYLVFDLLKGLENKQKKDLKKQIEKINSEKIT